MTNEAAGGAVAGSGSENSARSMTLRLEPTFSNQSFMDSTLSGLPTTSPITVLCAVFYTCTCGSKAWRFVCETRQGSFPLLTQPLRPSSSAKSLVFFLKNTPWKGGTIGGTLHE